MEFLTWPGIRGSLGGAIWEISWGITGKRYNCTVAGCTPEDRLHGVPSHAYFLHWVYRVFPKSCCNRKGNRIIEKIDWKTEHCHLVTHCLRVITFDGAFGTRVVEQQLVDTFETGFRSFPFLYRNAGSSTRFRKL